MGFAILISDVHGDGCSFVHHKAVFNQGGHSPIWVQGQILRTTLDLLLKINQLKAVTCARFLEYYVWGQVRPPWHVIKFVHRTSPYSLGHIMYNSKIFRLTLKKDYIKHNILVKKIQYIQVIY